MSVTIKSGDSGDIAAVTINKRLKTAAVSVTLTELATETGDTYNISTGTAALTTSNESALFYLKNNEDTDLLIDTIIVNIKDYVGTDGQPVLKIYRNPTDGTVISNATDAGQSNRNFGSSKSVDTNMYQGGEGETMSGQDAIIEVFLPSTAALTINAFTTLVVLKKGSSLGVSYTPPTGMTSVNIVVAVNVTLNGTQL